MSHFAEELIEEADLRFFGDDLHKALIIKGYLEQMASIHAPRPIESKGCGGIVSIWEP